ncbi:hypothetical protein GCM10029963_43100 [Micromonospora andamanensis]|uniref:hypothetical protein n=1 Tax=Micromonospora andamanensis TaxID=1287068 RepID=UPI001A4FB52F|nr:hypothetical protein [Micromonospora andamanensis]GIJ40686.1 hypothetical protein Vwe01_40110 [Micromonospora andamanensis]
MPAPPFPPPPATTGTTQAAPSAATTSRAVPPDVPGRAGSAPAAPAATTSRTVPPDLPGGAGTIHAAPSAATSRTAGTIHAALSDAADARVVPAGAGSGGQPPTRAAGTTEAAPVVPAPALPVWPPPTNPAGRRDEPVVSSPGAVPRPSSRPGLRPGSAGSLAAVSTSGGGPATTRTPSSTPEADTRVGTAIPDPIPGARVPGPAERAQRPAEASPGHRPGGSDLSAYYAGVESSATVAFPTGEQETSGSLTGHILAQGWADTAAERSSSTLRVVILMAVALGVLVGISVLVVLFANNALAGVGGGLSG